MEQAGPEPRQPAQQPTEPLPGSPGLIAVGIVLVVALVGLLAYLARGGDAGESLSRANERFPPATTIPVETVPATAAPTEPPPTTAAPTTAAPTTTAAPSTTATTTTTTPEATTTVPIGPVADVVPDVAAFPDHLATPEAMQAQVDQLLVSGRHDIAVTGPVRTVCAIVALDVPLALSGRWERDGRRIASTARTPREPPGFGDCLSDDGDPLAEGSYQYIASDADGDESAAGGLVVGAARIEQRFTNNGEEPVCAVRIAPTSSRYFEVYVFAAEAIAPGAEVTLPVAAVAQDVETLACGTREVLSSFDVEPDGNAILPLRP